MNSVVGQKIVETFPPDEIRRFHALNYVGQYTPSLKYEGAALQQRRVGLIEKGLPSVGATAGGAVGGFLGEGSPLAIGGGAYIGKEIGAKLQAGKVAREETKALKKMEKEQKKAAELGTKLSDVGK
jgi:flavin-dependent dehydrogenase